MIQSALADGSLTHTAGYSSATGQMKRIDVTGSNGSVHELHYFYDNYGNLESRTTTYNAAVSTETFTYDNLHRLRQSDRTSPGGDQTVLYEYDASGNLTLKDDYASEYFYDPDSRPNAVASVTRLDGSTATFGYDANGNLTQGDGKTLAYNAFKLDERGRGRSGGAERVDLPAALQRRIRYRQRRLLRDDAFLPGKRPGLFSLRLQHVRGGGSSHEQRPRRPEQQQIPLPRCDL